MEKEITTIIFDLAEVQLKGFYLVEEKLEKKLNLPAKEIHDKLRHSGAEEHFDLLMTGQISEDAYWKKVLEINKWDISINELKKAIRENFEEIEGTREIIEKLKEKGYKLGLLSDHSREWIDHCEKKFNYHKLFHSTLYSFEIKVRKPDKLIYLKIIEKLNVSPEECLFIDDWPGNLIPAEKLGMKTILFKNSIQLVEDLKKLGVEI